uniref:ATP synthase F0 subunit 6 n=1 Tax=Parasacculina shiinoi TaxID=2836419 RepID=UPI002551EBCB|nr:ATP synthase F0 subunit 6 [Parasacculina shiinoi]WGU20873.1 ATP synthase F0 subunit 6 [Parasacculina shiinoi]
MSNLFSIFDPVGSTLSVYYYIFIFLNFFYFFSSYWLLSSDLITFVFKFIDWLKNEIYFVKEGFNQLLMFLGLFFVLFSYNLVGLVPFTFVCSSQISMNYSICIFFMFVLVIKKWFFFPYKSMSSLVPVGTPFVLIFMMILVESISDWIRPITLSVRLSANLTAGHLILSLVGSATLYLMNMFILPVFLVYVILFILELMIAFIQSYVFVLLFLMYFKG